MRRRHAGLAVGALLTLIVCCSTPAAAQSVNRNLIRELNTQLLYVALPLTVFVEVILVYAVVRFRDNDDPEPTTDDAPLEVTWTIGTAIILLFVGVSAYVVLTTPYISPGAAASTGNQPGAAGDGETVRVLSYQWAYEFTYPEANVTSDSVLVLPARRNVTFRLTSADVIHSLFVPGLGIKQDAFPGKYTEARTYVYEPGQYQAYCAELCGSGHSHMRADVYVVDQSTYRAWLDAHRGEQNVTEPPPVPSASG
ncbi:MAG: cytochrome c oxidase subunit II [Haloarculaceae archaeon]